ncbi:MAG: hypothetical protein CMM15_13220 [Rhodospirillaceae bacterium]|nr:hypothetical protein [Rhodospirillaceae bacterium]|tara:strand:+ start:5192 stop:5632 length:441 start_codon:yes stop_codon:yes gene_type:complete
MSQTKNDTVVDISLNVIFLWLFVFCALGLSTIALIQASRASEKASEASEKASDAVNTSMLRDYVQFSDLDNTLTTYIKNEDVIRIRGKEKCIPGQQCGEGDQPACTAELSCSSSIKGPADGMMYATFQPDGGSSRNLIISKPPQPT